MVAHSKGFCVRAKDVAALVPPKPFALHLLQEREVNDIERVYQRLKEAESKAVPTSAPLVKYLERAVGSPLTIAASPAPPTLRFNAYAKQKSGRGSIVLHLVNYDVPRPEPQAAQPPVPAENVAITLHLPPGWKAVRVDAYAPGDPAVQTLRFQEVAPTSCRQAGWKPALRGGQVKFVVPQVHVYRVVEVQTVRQVPGDAR